MTQNYRGVLMVDGSAGLESIPVVRLNGRGPDGFLSISMESAICGVQAYSA